MQRLSVRGIAVGRVGPKPPTRQEAAVVIRGVVNNAPVPQVPPCDADRAVGYLRGCFRQDEDGPIFDPSCRMICRACTPCATLPETIDHLISNAAAEVLEGLTQAEQSRLGTVELTCTVGAAVILHIVVVFLLLD
jgi:hypothetical protein